MWVMPGWMEPYRGLIEDDKASAEVRMSQCEDVEKVTALPVADQLLPLVVRTRVRLLERLHKKGLLLPIDKPIRSKP